MKITIHRGTKEIGGTLVEIKSTNTRILIDAGFPLQLNGSVIEIGLEKLSKDELLELGVLPAVKGLYAWDEPSFDAVLISHAHLDHYGILKYIHPSIPIHMSEGTSEIIRLSQLFKIIDAFTKDIRIFKMYQAFNIGDITIKPFLMDHSAFDAAAFEISSAGKTIIYTGDFRGHGRKPKCIDRFIDGANKNADALLIEGTMLARQVEIVKTENELENELVTKLQNYSGPILFQSSGQNIDRIVSFYRAAVRLNRIFVIDIYTANVLSALRRLGNNKLPYPSKDFSKIKVFYPQRVTDRIYKEIGENYAKDFSPYWISRDEIKKSQNRIVMMVRPSMQHDLDSCDLHNGFYIYSLWEEYRKKPYEQKLEKYLLNLGFETYFLHTSGHAPLADIKKVISGLSPKKIVPIHTLTPDEFTQLSDKVEQQQDGVEFEV